MNLDNVFCQISDLCSFASVGLVAMAVSAIAIFVKIFKADFNQPD